MAAVFLVVTIVPKGDLPQPHPGLGPNLQPSGDLSPQVVRVPLIDGAQHGHLLFVGKGDTESKKAIPNGMALGGADGT